MTPYADPTVRAQKAHEAHLRRWADPAYRARENAKALARAKRPEVKARLKAAHKRRYADPEYRARVLAKNSEWFKAHPGSSLENTKRWQNRNRKLVREKHREWSRSTDGRAWYQERDHRRRAQEKQTQVDPSGIKAWMKEIRALPFVRCHWCGTKVKGRAVRFDHVVALSRGGGHTIGNLCASCNHCNLTKHARALSDWICQGQTFLPL